MGRRTEVYVGQGFEHQILNFGLGLFITLRAKENKTYFVPENAFVVHHIPPFPFCPAALLSDRAQPGNVLRARIVSQGSIREDANPPVALLCPVC